MKCNDLQELAAAHAVGALGGADSARVEALAARDEDVRAEVAAFRDAAAALAIGQPVSATPGDAVRVKILERVARTPQSKTADAATTKGFLFRRHGEGEWQATPVPGLRIKPLAISRDLGHWTVLAELAPGALFPTHDHSGSEDLMVLSGELVTEGRTLGPGDFLHAGPGTHHEALLSPNGCVALVVEPIPPHVLAALDAA